jgi:hypothetical protein
MKRILGGQCVGCGSTECLEIHHKIPADKSFTLSLEFDRPWREIENELLKCELRCEACHKLEHAAKHGLGMYSHQKCRCDVCKMAWSVATKRYKQKAKEKQLAPS